MMSFCAIPSIRLIVIVLSMLALSPWSAAHAELSEAEWVRRDLAALAQGDYYAQRAAMDRLVSRGPGVVPDVAGLLTSEDAETRGMAAQALERFGPDAGAACLPGLLEAMRVETDDWALGCMTHACIATAEDLEPVAAVLLERIAQGGASGAAAAECLYELEIDLSGAKPVLMEALSAGWAENKCYLFWTLDRGIGLTEDDLPALSRVDLGPKPAYWERAGDRPGEIDDNYMEVRDWAYVVEPLSERLRESPELYLVFLRNHPGALTVYRENEPWLIYLFSEASAETRALRDYLVTREDLPGMFEIDVAAGERVGVLESYPTTGNACFPEPERISVVVRDGRCDIADAPVPEGYGIDFSYGLAPIAVDGRFGYTDEAGVIRIAPRYEFAGRFREDRALVRQAGLMGMIDTTGAYLVEPRFQEVMGFHGRLWRVSEDGLFGLMYETGEMFVEPTYAHLGLDAEMQITAVTPAGTAGTIDAEGTFVPDPE